MGIIKECIDARIITMEDYHKKFNFDGYTLKDVRCWKKKFHAADSNIWKFNNYKIHCESQTPFINNNSGHKRGECELCCSLNNYKSKPNSSGEIIRNNKIIMWIGYKY